MVNYRHTISIGQKEREENVEQDKNRGECVCRVPF